MLDVDRFKLLCLSFSVHSLPTAPLVIFSRVNAAKMGVIGKVLRAILNIHYIGFSCNKASKLSSVPHVFTRFNRVPKQNGFIKVNDCQVFQGLILSRPGIQ